MRQQFELGLVTDAGVRTFDLDTSLIELHDQAIHRYFEYLGELGNRYISHQ
jgi:hypothetical protein